MRRAQKINTLDKTTVERKEQRHRYIGLSSRLKKYLQLTFVL